MGSELHERWAEPVIPIEVGASGWILQLQDGRVFSLPTLILKEADIERLRLGYVCISCLEPFSAPYPRKCSFCGWPVRELQPHAFEKLYAGEEEVGPRTTLEEEWEIAKDEVQRGRWARKGVWLPGGD